MSDLAQTSSILAAAEQCAQCTGAQALLDTPQS